MWLYDRQIIVNKGFCCWKISRETNSFDVWVGISFIRICIQVVWDEGHVCIEVDTTVDHTLTKWHYQPLFVDLWISLCNGHCRQFSHVQCDFLCKFVRSNEMWSFTEHGNGWMANCTLLNFIYSVAYIYTQIHIYNSLAYTVHRYIYYITGVGSGEQGGMQWRNYGGHGRPPPFDFWLCTLYCDSVLLPPPPPPRWRSAPSK